MRRQPPTHPSPPVVRPSDLPFPFETDMHQQQSHQQQVPMSRPGPSNRPHLHIPSGGPQVNPQRPLEPHHYLPSMGLGGALIAHNRSRHHHQHPYRQQLPYEGGSSFLGRVGSGVRRMLGGPALAPGDGPRNGINFLAMGGNFGFLDDDDPDRLLALQLLAEGDGEGLGGVDPAFSPARAFIRSEVIRRRINAREESPYRKEYTHPHPPETGFTFDFAPKAPVEVIEISSPSERKKRVPSPDPIIIDEDDLFFGDAGYGSSPKISAPSSPSTSPSKAQAQPGTPKSPANATFLVCARCLEPLILGNSLTSEEQKERRVWGLRCGHLIDGKCLKEIGQPLYTDQPPVEPTTTGVVPDRKGKGKAKAVDMDDEDVFHPPGAYQPDQDLEPEHNNSIRSRLRPRLIQTHSSLSSPPTTVLEKRNTRGKRALQLPPPKYIWNCPVTGCGRIHASMRVDGNWIPEREDAIYGDGTNGGNGGRNGGRGRGRGGARRGRGRLAIPEILNDDPMNAAGSSNGESARGAIPLFL